MKAKVTKRGVTVPKELLEGMDEVEMYRQDGAVIIVSSRDKDPVFEIGDNPIDDEITDASVNHDHYIYTGK